MNPETKICQNCKKDFVIESDDFLFYEKMKVPAPNVCPDCRYRMRAVWRNEMSLYNSTCVMTGERIISAYNPKSPYRVVSLDYYKSEAWNPFSFGRVYDTRKSFFEQFDILLKDVYKKALFPISSVGQNIESDYVNFAGGCKNSYFCFNTAFVENVMYSKGVTNAKDSLDLYYNDHIEHCYECVNVYHSSSVSWAKNSTGCLDCVLIENCHNCSNCFGSVNLRNQSYHFFNQKLTKEEYFEAIAPYVGSRQGMCKAKEKFATHTVSYPKRASQNLNSVGCTGDLIFDSKNCHNCFEIGMSEDCKYIFGARKNKDSYGLLGGIGASESLESMTPNHSSRMVGTIACENSKNILYSFVLNNCSDCIGCDSLRNAQYCILNKQYSKEEYEEIKSHIIVELTEQGIYGLMPPAWISPFAYNETVGQDNMPLTEEEALYLGFRFEHEIQMTQGKETISRDDIPDSLIDVSDSITKEILSCSLCNRNYRITEQEFALCRRLYVPIPNVCFYCRHKDRVARRGPCQFWKRSCMKCSKDIQTNYSPESPEIVYCESCYQQEVL